MDDRVGRLASLSYEVALAEDIGELRRVVTSGLRTVIDADLASYTEVTRTATLALLDLPAIDLTKVGPRLAELAHQHPLIVRHAPGAEAISDHLSDARFRALELYHDIYGPLEAVDQLAITIHHDEEVTVGLALNRSRRGFSEADRQALEALAIVVRAARARVVARARARELLEALQRDTVSGQVGVIALSDRGELDFVSDQARHWLRAYFPDHGAAELPLSLRTRLLEGPPGDGRTLTVHGEEGTLTIRRLPAHPGEPRLLELHQRRRSSDHELTAREHEILERVASGDTNAAIARTLDISSRTVENHLRAIYRKLEVNSRTAAVARVRV
ncbi:MAG TPA: LuxR C-terminal-related transcriptional regulator [Solirubrobacteraceae bacterium]|nr:LuxR C-terminal-related transcriptional regulator [Solirubrobacteraceae bacterium]